MPSYRDALSGAARLHESGKLHEAVAAYREAIDANPESADAYYGLALVHHTSGALGEAIAAFKEVARRTPHDATVWNNLGVLYHALDELPAAEESFRRALELDGDYGEAKRNLGVVTSGRNGAAGRLAFFCGPDDKFLRDIMRHFATRWEVRAFRGGTVRELQDLMAWSDVSWFEWCDNLIIEASRLPKTAQVICRLHRYEAFTDAPKKVNWRNVDRLVFTAEQIRDLLLESMPDLRDGVRTEVVHYGVDLDRFSYSPRERGYDVAYVGYIHNRKNPSLLLQCVRALVDVDPRYTLHVAGYHQERLYEMYWEHMVRELGLDDNVRMYGWVEDVDRWLGDKQYLLSTSVHESFGYGIAEGMARGLKAVVHNFPGAAALWPRECLFNTVNECRRMIVSKDYDSSAYRRYIEEHYPLSAQLARLDALIGELSQSPVDGDGLHVARAHPVAKAQSAADAQPARLASEPHPTRVNLACGSHYHQGYLNVDFSDAFRHDLKADVTDLAMIPDDTFEEALASHILEHLTPDGAARALCEWRRILKPGGWLEVRVPDVDWLLRSFHEGRMSRADFVTRVYGDTRVPGAGVETPEDLKDLVARCVVGQISVADWCARVYDGRYGHRQNGEAHRWGWDLDALTRELRKAGFERVFAVAKDAPLDPDVCRPGRVDPATLVMRADKPGRARAPSVVRRVGVLRLGLLLPELKELPNPRYCSISKIVAGVVPYYVDKGVEVHVFCRQLERPAEETLEGVHYHRHRYGSVADYARWAAEQCDGLNVDLVEVLNRPWVLGTRARQIIRMANDHLRADQSPALQGVSRLVVLSEYLRRKTIAKLPDLADRVVVNHEGVDLDAYRPCAKHEAPTLLYVGVLQREKGLHHLVDLANRLTEEVQGLRVVIAGPTSVSGDGDQSFVAEMRARTPANTTWLGEVDDEDLPGLYGSATVFVAPMTFPFTWSLALVEAQACGTPVITTPLGGLPETLMHGETGFLVRTAEELFQRARDLLLHRDAAAEMGCRGREFARRFGWSGTAHRALAIYRDVLDGPERVESAACGPRSSPRRLP